MYVIIDNYDSFTHNIYQYLSELTEKKIFVIRNDKTSIQEIESLNPDGIIISPGPGTPEDAGISVEVIKAFIGRVPILGVCLGHQCIGHALGGKIIQANEIIHGKTDSITTDGKGVFRSIPSPAVFTRYHSLVIERESLPQELEITAETSNGLIMGVRHKTQLLEGVQFHPESIASEYGKRLLNNFLNYRLEPFNFKVILSKLIDSEDLSFEEAELFMDEVTDGNLTTAQTAAILVALNAKGVKANEIAGCASVLRKKKVAVDVQGPLLDTCGTGGDGLGTFNISSFAALIASSCGVKVAKHGNRAVSSKSGSAEFYSALGLDITADISMIKRSLVEEGFSFLFAPQFHKAMKHAAQPRKELGIKTIFNLIGPLSNPANAEYQLVGVYSEKVAREVAKAARLLGVKKIMVVHGKDGEDEISVSGETTTIFIDETDNVVEDTLLPESLGISRHAIDDIVGGSAKENAAIAEELLAGKGPVAIRDAVCANAGAAMFIYGKVNSIREGYESALEALKTGKVSEKLQRLRKMQENER